VDIKNNWWAVAGFSSGNNWWSQGSSPAVIRDDGTAPCYNEITDNTGKYIRFHVVKRNDIGKTIRLYGTQFGGQPLQEKDANGDWIPGLTITAAAPYAQTTVLVTKITDVQIPVPLQGMSYLYQVNADTTLLDLAAYQPGESNPSYRVSKIEGMCSLPSREDSYGRKLRKAECLVKLEFIPALVDEDWVMIDNKAALAFGIQGLRLEQNNDDVAAEVKWAKSIRELNMELRRRNPDMQTTIRVNDISAYGAICNPY
jgi:hypothetical protein